jgi:hypothetical protein
MASKKPKKSQSAQPRAVSKGRPKTKATSPSAKGTVYQLKITLKDIRPPIWRRVLTRDCTLAKLHDIIQAVMGWDDYHLHEFEIGEQRYGDPVQWHSDFISADPDVANEGKVKLSQLAGQGVKKFRYQYDMGDSWWHTIAVEKTLLAEAGVKYPRCVAGERACPPEDCGGPWGYGDLVDTIQNPKHKRHAELLEWIGGHFDPEAFDLEATNKEL